MLVYRHGQLWLQGLGQDHGFMCLLACEPAFSAHAPDHSNAPTRCMLGTSTLLEMPSNLNSVESKDSFDPDPVRTLIGALQSSPPPQSLAQYLTMNSELTYSVW